MNRSEKLLLAAAFLFAGAIAAVSLAEGARLLSGAGASRVDPVAGEPRDVDMERLRRLLRTRALSEHEALHYRRMDEPGAD